MEIWLPHCDFSQAIGCLADEDLLETRLSAYHVLRILQGNSQRCHYQLSGGDKGTVISSANGTRVRGNHPLVQRWEAYDAALTFYYNTTLIICSFRGLPEKNFQSWSFSSAPSAINPSWLTKEFCKRHRESLKNKNPRFYSRIF